MLKSGSLDIYKNTVVLMIVMLGYSELNIEVSDIDIKTTESDNYRGLSKDDRDTNGVLAVI